VPRNVVTVARRRTWTFWRGSDRVERQDRAVVALTERFRLRASERGDRFEIDFPKSLERRAAKAEVVAELERIDPDWGRLFVVYPLDRNLRDER
jgi:hypothetical protein